MKNNELKVIRTVKLNRHKIHGNIIKYDVEREEEFKSYIADSEFLRIVEALDGYVDERGRKYLRGVITIKLGDYSDALYKKLEDNGQILVLKHYKRVYSEDGTYTLEETGTEEQFMRAIVNSSHIRQSKAMFVRVDLYEKVHKILLGGIDAYAEKNHYPMYAKGAAKWSAYYGLACTDSMAVKEVPNIVVIEDFKKSVTDKFDIVTQHKSIDEDWDETKDSLKNKYKKTYSVERGIEREKEIMPFDGAGLVSVECAKKWCRDLRIRGYVPAAWQFRAIPGIKGNVYTFDIQAFGAEHGFIITDIKGVPHDIRTEKIDVILTKSQTKFLELFDNDIDLWKKVFKEPVIFYKKEKNGEDTETIDCQYQRTFNICDYSENPKELDSETRSAYQHLQTIMFTEQERKAYIQKTIDKVKAVSTDVEKFLQYRGCCNVDEEDSYIPPYYIAATKLNKEGREIFFADPYMKEKVAKDIKALKFRAMSGKEIIDGNYQVLTPDIYGLAQYAFGEREVNQIGILMPYEVYSNWWLKLYGEVPEELAIVRNPHIFMEARVVNLVTEPTESMTEEEQERRRLIFKWFKYQNTGIITDAYSTVPLALGTADFDGDHVQTTNSKEYIEAVKRAIKAGNGYTVDWFCDGQKEEIKAVDVTDVKTLMSYDRLGYANDIGTVIDKVTLLWGIKQNEENSDTLMKYIAIADIIGQLTIDSAKTGEYEKFYEPIDEYYKGLGVKTPYFKRYLSKYADKVAKENRAIKNAEFYYSDDVELIESQAEFSDEPTNVNLICHALEEEFAKVQENVDSDKFDLDAFLKLFITDNVPVRTDLYKRVKMKLLELAERNGRIFRENRDDDNSDIGNQYKWFYHYCRTALLNECKLGIEKSMEKVLNIIIYLCYCDKDVTGNNAKAVMWNAFGDELIQRVMKKPLNEIVLSGKQMNKTGAEKKAVLENVHKKPTFPIEVDKVLFTEDMWEYIKSATKPYHSNKAMKSKQNQIEDAVPLRRLAIVLMVLNTSMRYDVEVEREDGERVIYERQKVITLYSAANGKLNKTLLAKICGFTDNQRKNMDTYLKTLAQKGIIEISRGRMANIRVKVLYGDKFDSGENLISDEVKKSKDLYVISSDLFKQKRL